MDDWTKDCELLESIQVDVCFCINEDFYYGPRDVVSIAERKQTTPLPSPTHKPASNFNLRTLKAEEHTETLLAYYREVLRLAENYKRSPLEISHYFWLKLSFWEPQEHIASNFPWYDTLEQMAPVLESIMSGKEGLLFHDEDQEWEVEIRADNKYIYIREGNVEDGELSLNHKIPREQLAMDCGEALHRARSLVAWLSDELEHDYWSKPAYAETLLAKPKA